MVLMMWAAGTASAQLDPSHLEGAQLWTADGVCVAELGFEKTEPGWADGYAYVGLETWAWTESPWPAESLVLVSAETGVEGGTVLHQATFPEEATLEEAPDGELVYALSRKDGPVGWLVVDGSALTWVLHPEAQVGALIELGAGELRLDPVEAVDGEGPFRAITQVPVEES